mgnify:CR=1 FL=1
MEYKILKKDVDQNTNYITGQELQSNIILYLDNNDIILHCAEAPGGFIQGTNIYLQIEKFHNSINKESSKIKIEIDDDGFTKYINKKKLSKKENASLL